MSRHPYTYAADFVRSLGPINSAGVVLSRSDAAHIHREIAKAIGMDEEQMAIKLSEAEQAKSEEDIQQQGQKLIRAMFPNLATS